MTQLTVPDNIPSPTDNDGYALTQDLGAMAQGMQDALITRANLYKGPAASRMVFTDAEEGVHWQDTDGDKGYYVRQGGQWEPVGGDTGWKPITVNSPYQAMDEGEEPALRKYNGVVYAFGGFKNTNITGGVNNNNIATFPLQFAPTQNVIFRAGTASGNTSASIFFRGDGGIDIRPSTTVSAYYKLDGLSWLVA